MLCGLCAAVLALLFAASSAHALIAAPDPLPMRLAVSKYTIVVGKVTALEEKPRLAKQFQGQIDKVEWTIAEIKVEDSLLGAKGLTHARVGFVPPRKPNPNEPISSGSLRQRVLKVGDEGIFYLTPHFEEVFYTAPGFFDVTSKAGNPNFDKEVALVRRCAKLLEDLPGSLKSKDKDDRFMAAAMLLVRHRTPTGVGKPVEKAIDAAESRAILEALADADWSKPLNFQELHPQMVFGRLGVGPNDGFMPPRMPKEYAAAAQKWCKDNAGKYVIKGYVAAPK
jgi:hypothetical protein